MPTVMSGSVKRAVLAVVVLGGIALGALGAATPTAPCPASQRATHPSDVHLTPSLVEHKSWLGVPTSELRAGDRIAACVDGRQVGWDDVHLEDLLPATYTLGVHTRWIALTWLTGRLDAYRDPSRWTVVWL